MRKTLADRFWEKVDVQGSDDCWEWLGYKGGSSGYGQIGVDGKTQYATHVLFKVRHGYWPPKGRTANHHCDNPGCLNPRHLYLGTQKSNMCDKVKRGRESHLNGAQNGEQNGHAKLTMSQVKEIRKQAAKCGVTQKQLGHMFRVSRSTISAIVTGRNWNSDVQHQSY